MGEESFQNVREVALESRDGEGGEVRSPCAGGAEAAAARAAGRRGESAVFVFFTAVLGLYRFDYVLNRMHAAAVGDAMRAWRVPLHGVGGSAEWK